MGTISVGGQRLTFDQIARTEASHEYVLVVEYYGRGGGATDTARIDLSLSGRRGATKETIQAALAEWLETESDVTIRSFEVVERIECREGERVPPKDGQSTDGKGPEAIDGPVPGVEPDALSKGDRVAYYVEGPHSSVYGYVAEGVVEKTPPWQRGIPGKGEVVDDRAVLDLGDRTREVPLAWIIGSTEDEEIVEAVDRQYPA